MKELSFLIENVFIVTCSPGYESYAYDELKKIDASLSGRSALDKGIFRVRSELPFTEFSRMVQLADPIFTRHIQPVDAVLEIDRTKEDLLRFIELLQIHSSRITPGTKTAIQVRRTPGVDFDYTAYGVKEALDPFLLERGAVTAIQKPESVVSLYLTDSEAYFGISRAGDNLSDWSGGAIRLRKEQDRISRARFKLEEACQVFGIRLDSYSHALDLGAAPGGWTSYLLDKGLRVTAVDTGTLDPTVLGHPKLLFFQDNAAKVSFPENTFDVITCDMSWDPLHTSKIVKQHASGLRKQGILILTIKLMRNKILQTIADCICTLEPDFEKKSVKQLFHNRDEVTAFLVKK